MRLSEVLRSASEGLRTSSALSKAAAAPLACDRCDWAYSSKASFRSTKRSASERMHSPRNSSDMACSLVVAALCLAPASAAHASALSTARLVGPTMLAARAIRALSAARSTSLAASRSSSLAAARARTTLASPSNNPFKNLSWTTESNSVLSRSMRRLKKASNPVPPSASKQFADAYSELSVLSTPFNGEGEKDDGDEVDAGASDLTRQSPVT
mmetsp:Transcript_74468/g.145478  ORF Transcript_74468/g.145478 Transcript_74468/m.145478 type:complete len:213 (+) Transcript_74468:266-904(+)